MTAARTTTRALAALAVAVTLVAVPAAPAPAQDAAPSIEVVLTGISPAASPKDPLGHRVAVRNRGQAPIRVQQVEALLGQPVDTRSELGTVLAAPGGSVGDRQVDAFQPADVEVAPLQPPEPTLAVAIKARSKADEDKLANALHRLADEDPTIRVERNSETHQTLLWGLGGGGVALRPL